MTDSVSLWQRCPACGEALDEPAGTLGRSGPTCAACGRQAAAQEHPFFGVYDAVEYDFDDVTPSERAAATDLLISAGVPYRWDPGSRLQVPPDREEEVDVLFGHLPPRPETAQEPGQASNGEQQWTDAEGPEPVDWIADEQSAQALADLFDAADRLRHRPDDEAAVADLADASGVVMTAAVPFGVNGVLWSTADYLARQLFDLLEARADRDDIVAAADALRAVLRDHI